jgi:antitoxin ParD1/3/4
MNVSLTPELEKFVHDKIEGGLYTSASEVVRESLRLMHTYDDLQKQRIHQLNEAIEVGLAQADIGKMLSSEDSYKRMKKLIGNIAAKKK